MSNKAKTLLQNTITKFGSIAAVARKINDMAGKKVVARSSLSLFLNDKYPADSGQISQTIMTYLGDETVICPATGDRISTAQYERNLTATMPQNNPAELKKWGIYRSLKSQN